MECGLPPGVRAEQGWPVTPELPSRRLLSTAVLARGRLCREKSGPNLTYQEPPKHYLHRWPILHLYILIETLNSSSKAFEHSIYIL